jgi:hypothetical protein
MEKYTEIEEYTKLDNLVCVYVCVSQKPGGVSRCLYIKRNKIYIYIKH